MQVRTPSGKAFERRKVFGKGKNLIELPDLVEVQRNSYRWFFQAEAEHRGSQGLQELFLKYGAQTAINLDGGGSAKLYFYGQVINRPSSPTRQVSDALIFK